MNKATFPNRGGHGTQSSLPRWKWKPPVGCGEALQEGIEGWFAPLGLSASNSAGWSSRAIKEHEVRSQPLKTAEVRGHHYSTAPARKTWLDLSPCAPDKHRDFTQQEARSHQDLTYSSSSLLPPPGQGALTTWLSALHSPVPSGSCFSKISRFYSCFLWMGRGNSVGS